MKFRSLFLFYQDGGKAMGHFFVVVILKIKAFFDDINSKFFGGTF